MSQSSSVSCLIQFYIAFFFAYSILNDTCNTCYDDKKNLIFMLRVNNKLRVLAKVILYMS